MIELKDLNPHDYKTTPIIDKNLSILLERVRELEASFGEDFVITSGLRSDEQQQQLIKAGKTNARYSKHCAGLAADIYDPENKVKDFILGRTWILEKIGLWCEDFGHTPNWVHVQIIPPMSGKRFFIP